MGTLPVTILVIKQILSTGHLVFEDVNQGCLFGCYNQLNVLLRIPLFLDTKLCHWVIGSRQCGEITSVS